MKLCLWALAAQVAGASIQCYMKGCYTPFHASCARYNGNYMAERVEWDTSHPEAPVKEFGNCVCYCARHTKMRRRDLMRQISHWAEPELLERAALPVANAMHMLSFLSRQQARAAYDYWNAKRAKLNCFLVRRLQASIEEAMNVEYCPYIPYLLSNGEVSISHTQSAKRDKHRRRNAELEEEETKREAAAGRAHHTELKMRIPVQKEMPGASRHLR